MIGRSGPAWRRTAWHARVGCGGPELGAHSGSGHAVRVLLGADAARTESGGRRGAGARGRRRRDRVGQTHAGSDRGGAACGKSAGHFGTAIRISLHSFDQLTRVCMRVWVCVY